MLLAALRMGLRSRSHLLRLRMWLRLRRRLIRHGGPGLRRRTEASRWTRSRLRVRCCLRLRTRLPLRSGPYLPARLRPYLRLRTGLLAVRRLSPACPPAVRALVQTVDAAAPEAQVVSAAARLVVPVEQALPPAADGAVHSAAPVGIPRRAERPRAPHESVPAAQYHGPQPPAAEQRLLLDAPCSGCRTAAGSAPPPAAPVPARSSPEYAPCASPRVQRDAALPRYRPDRRYKQHGSVRKSQPEADGKHRSRASHSRG